VVAYNNNNLSLIANSQILAQYTGPFSSAAKYLYLHDRLGSIRQVIDIVGDADVQCRYTYDPFGELFDSEAEETEGLNPFKFTGQYFDDEISQYHLRARQYDPHIARFTSRDPAIGKFEEPLSLHRYLYCQNEPISRKDPFGQDYIDINFTWTYGIVPGMLQGALIGSASTSPIGTAIGAGVGATLGGFGVTGGLMIERNEAHFYLGPSWTSNLAGGVDFTMSLSPSPETTVEQGWSMAFSTSISGAYSQWGISFGPEGESSRFWEGGMTSGTSMGYGVNFSIFYVFPGIGKPSFSGRDPRSAFRDLDLLDRAIMMNEMREDTGELISGGGAGIGFYSTYAVTANMLLDM